MSRPYGNYSDLRPNEIEEILEKSPIAYVPWGALEWHSLHAPIGLDSVKAEGICQALASETGGVVLPAIPMGVNTIKPFKGFPHSIDISTDLASRVAEEFCLQLADEGFKIVIFLRGIIHPNISMLFKKESTARGPLWIRRTSKFGLTFIYWEMILKRTMLAPQRLPFRCILCPDR
jgi:hypothetical protein